MADQPISVQLKIIGEKNDDEFCIICNMPRCAEDIIDGYNENLCSCCYIFCQDIIKLSDYGIYLETSDGEYDLDPDEIVGEMFDHVVSPNEQCCNVCYLPRDKQNLVLIQNVTVCECCYKYGRNKVDFSKMSTLPTFKNTVEPSSSENCQLDESYLNSKTINYYGEIFLDESCLICNTPRLFKDTVNEFKEFVCHCCYQYSKNKINLLDFGLTLKTPNNEARSSQSDLNKLMASPAERIRSELLRKQKAIYSCFVCLMPRRPRDYIGRQSKLLCHCCESYGNKIARRINMFPGLRLSASEKLNTSLDSTSEDIDESSEILEVTESSSNASDSAQSEMRNEMSQSFDLFCKNSFKYSKYNQVIRSSQSEIRNNKQANNALLPTQSLSINNDSNQTILSKIVKFNILAIGIEKIYSEAFQLYKELQDILKKRHISLPEQNPSLFLPCIPIDTLCNEEHKSNGEKIYFQLKTTNKSEKSKNESDDGKDSECNTSAAKQNGKVIECSPEKKNYPKHSTPLRFNNGTYLMSPVIHQTLKESPFSSPLTPNPNTQSYFVSGRSFFSPQLRNHSKINESTSRECATLITPVLHSFRTTNENSDYTKSTEILEYSSALSTDTSNTSAAKRNLFSGAQFSSTNPSNPSKSPTISSPKDKTISSTNSSDPKEVREDSNLPSSTTGNKTPKRKLIGKDSLSSSKAHQSIRR